MAWYIASVPFWAMAAFWMLSAAVAVPLKRPHETSEDVAVQIIISLIVSGIFGCIAAWLVS